MPNEDMFEDVEWQEHKKRVLGASVETIANAVEWRVGRERMSELREKHGYGNVDWALSHVGEFYQGCEEIGSSDVSFMTDMFLRTLGEPSVMK